MTKLDRKQLQLLEQQYPGDPTRQIASYVLANDDARDQDRLCAAGILNALDAAEHADDLLITGVSRSSLQASATADAARLWIVYGEKEFLDLPDG